MFPFYFLTKKHRFEKVAKGAAQGGLFPNIYRTLLPLLINPKLHHRRPQTVRKATKRETRNKKRRATWQEPTTSTVIQARKQRSGALQQEFQGSGALPVPVAWLRVKPGTSPSPNKMMRDRIVGHKVPGESCVTNPRSSYPRKPKKR